MKTSKFLSAVAVLGLAGTVGFAYAQTSTTDTTDSANNPASTTGERIVEGERRVDSAAQDAADTMENNPPAAGTPATGMTDRGATGTDLNRRDAGSTMDEEQVARADRN